MIILPPLIVLQLISQQTQQLLILIFDLPIGQTIAYFEHVLMRLCVVLLQDMADGDVILELVVVEGEVGEGEVVELVEELVLLRS